MSDKPGCNAQEKQKTYRVEEISPFCLVLDDYLDSHVITVRFQELTNHLTLRGTSQLPANLTSVSRALLALLAMT